MHRNLIASIEKTGEKIDIAILQAPMLIENFTDRAQEFVRLAERANSDRDRDLFFKMARAWYGLSE
jgi:hypothetical protein